MLKNSLKKLDQKKVSNFLYLTIVLLGLYLFHITYNKEGFANSVNSISRFEDLEAVSESVEDNNLIQNNNTILSNNKNNKNNNNNNNNKNSDNKNNNTKNNDNSSNKANNKIPSYRRKVNLYFFTVPILPLYSVFLCSRHSCTCVGVEWMSDISETPRIRIRTTSPTENFDFSCCRSTAGCNFCMIA